MAEGLDAALEGLVGLIDRHGGSGRVVAAIAGPPGAGKSTVAEALGARLNREAPGTAAVLPMDGFHYDDRVLDDLGLKPRKGAPETFDVAGLRHMLSRLRENAEPEVAVPVFDRDLEISRAGARLVPRSVRVLIVEGNYLLLDHPPWSSLQTLFDVTAMIAPPEAVLRERLERRWRGYGLAPEAVAAKVEANDLPNGRLVTAQSAAAQIRFEA